MNFLDTKMFGLPSVWGPGNLTRERAARWSISPNGEQFMFWAALLQTRLYCGFLTTRSIMGRDTKDDVGGLGEI